MKTVNEYNHSWYMTTKAGAIYRKISGQFTTLYDIVRDYKLTGTSLAKYVNSIDKSKSTGSESTRYWSLDTIFKDFDFNQSGGFIDIGCGKGRVLAYMHSKGYKGKLFGIEHNPAVAEFTKQWTDKKDNITIFSGDAFNLNFNDYSFMFFNRPFTQDVFAQFVKKIESEMTHELTIFCYADTYMSKALKQSGKWEKQDENVIFKKGILAYSYYPLRYTIWKYNV